MSSNVWHESGVIRCVDWWEDNSQEKTLYEKYLMPLSNQQNSYLNKISLFAYSLAQLQKMIHSALMGGTRWQYWATLVWVQIETTGLERHSNQAFKMFMPFISLLGIYPKEIILDVGKHPTL